MNKVDITMSAETFRQLLEGGSPETIIAKTESKEPDKRHMVFQFLLNISKAFNHNGEITADNGVYTVKRR